MDVGTLVVARLSCLSARGLACGNLCYAPYAVKPRRFVPRTGSWSYSTQRLTSRGLRPHWRWPMVYLWSGWLAEPSMWACALGPLPLGWCARWRRGRHELRLVLRLRMLLVRPQVVTSVSRLSVLAQGHVAHQALGWRCLVDPPLGLWIGPLRLFHTM